MSSMFKKKGGLAFKPKAKPRQPARPAAPAKPTKTVDSQIAPDSPEGPTRDETESPRITDPPHDDVASKSAPSRPSRATRASAVPDQTTQPTPTESAREVAPVEAEPEAPVEKTTPKTRSTPKTARATRAAAQPSIEPTIEEPDPPAATETNTQEGQGEPSDDVAAEPAATTSQQATSQSDQTPAPARKPATRKPKGKRLTAPQPTDDAETDGAATRPKKRQRKSPQTEDGETEPKTRSRRRQASSDGPASTPRRARSQTPDDAEAQVVDLQKLKMSDLTRDLHIGKKFSRHDELRDRERQARIDAKLRKDGEQVGDEGEEAASQTPGPSNASANGANIKPAPSQASAPSASAPAAGPQFRIVDGQIVVDQSSLMMDRHARAAAEQTDMETIEENDFTRLITSSSFMNTSKLKGPNIWTPPETELFYRGLRMFGTDFEMISQMFPGKQRRHVKLKFNREERHNPGLIDAALIGEKTISMDIDEYKAATGSEFETVEAIEAEQRRVQDEYEAERQRVVDEQAEAMRKKREELFADDDKGNGKKKKKEKKGKNDDPSKYGDLVEVEEG